MAIQRLGISEFLERSEDRVMLDVRSPGEYNHAHIPGALSLPLFTDEERKIVGTAYKQNSREEAIKIGLDFFGPKMKTVVEATEKFVLDKKQKNPGAADTADIKGETIYMYCWRGGMRSGAMAWLLDLYGFKVCTLAGGYKAFRNHVLKSFEQPLSLRILGGYTGSGKTEVLNQLAKTGETVIDLEGIACHKGSAFGSFNMPAQPTQEMFENLLSTEVAKVSRLSIKNETPVIWLEDESQRIGNLNIPNAFWQQMRAAPVFFMDIPFDERLSHLVAEYGSCDRQKLAESTLRISKRLGPMETKNTIAFLEQDNLKEAFRILLQYYDKRYSKGLHNRDNILSLLTKIPCDTVSLQNAALLTKLHPA